MVSYNRLVGAPGGNPVRIFKEDRTVGDENRPSFDLQVAWSFRTITCTLDIVYMVTTFSLKSTLNLY
jgi:hypothetical protein